MPNNRFKDQELLKQILKPSTAEHGFRQLVEAYQRILYAHIRRITGNHDDTDDALQETFIRAWTKITSFRGEAPLYFWLLGIATNEALIVLRKRKVNSLVMLNIQKQDSCESFVQIQGPGGSEIENKLNLAMKTLGVKQRAIFGMRYFDELPYAEISQVLNQPEGTIKSTYHQAFIKIKKFLEING